MLNLQAKCMCTDSRERQRSLMNQVVRACRACSLWLAWEALEILHNNTASAVPALCCNVTHVANAGIVVANDADAQRCNLLAHQTKRMCSPALIVTNHDATMYPIVIDHAAKVTVASLSCLCSRLLAAHTHWQLLARISNLYAALCRLLGTSNTLH